ncbi:MAG: proton-conducting membrane transporter [Lachnospiraceae bacterium]|jgi:formate hydrogenlyase subunit 3/multisubunit Na+/H+ antiporter MnhD subunit|nr:proton-conducting membrane transporter [Lachnospiraceae bacterium]
MNRAYLVLPVVLPILGGALMPLLHLPEKKRNLFLELLVILTSVIAVLCVLQRPEEGFIMFHLTGNLDFALRLDGLGSVFTCLIAGLWPLATLYAFEYMRHEERTTSFFAFYTMTYGVTLGIAMAENLVTMYLFYELLTLVSVYLVMHPMTRKALHASRTYLYYSIGGAAFAFISLIFVIAFGNTTDFVPGGVLDPEKVGGSIQTIQVVYLMAFWGFGVKAAVFPFQGWLPRASVAPTPVTALLHAVAVVKSGAFAVMRLTYYCFNIEMLRGTWVHLAVMGIAMLSILYGSTMAVRETHFKRRLAFSTVSNLSYILLGVTMMSPLGLLAGISHLIFHAVMKIGAFFCAGAVLHQSGREYVDELNGLGRKMPLVFGTFVIFGLSLTGIPLFAGFISKWNIAQAAMDTGRAYPFAYAAVAVLLYSALMTGLYTLTTAVRAWFPDREPEAKNNAVSITDPNWEMKLPLGIFATVIVGLGLFSEPLMEILRSVAWGRF